MDESSDELGKTPIRTLQSNFDKLIGFSPGSNYDKLLLQGIFGSDALRRKAMLGVGIHLSNW